MSSGGATSGPPRTFEGRLTFCDGPLLVDISFYSLYRTGFREDHTAVGWNGGCPDTSTLPAGEARANQSVLMGQLVTNRQATGMDTEIGRRCCWSPVDRSFAVQCRVYGVLA